MFSTSCQIKGGVQNKMSVADIPKMYKDLQMRSAVVSEKERAIAMKRQALAELRQHVQGLGDQCQKKQQMVTSEAMKFQQKKQLQDMKWGERHRHEAAETERLQAVQRDEQTMAAGIAQMEEDTANLTQQLQDARSDSKLIEETKTSISELSASLELEDGRLVEFERAVAKMETLLATRSQKLSEQLPSSYSLPMPGAHGAAAGAGDIAGESIMLVDEFAY